MEPRIRRSQNTCHRVAGGGTVFSVFMIPLSEGERKHAAIPLNAAECREVLSGRAIKNANFLYLDTTRMQRARAWIPRGVNDNYKYEREWGIENIIRYPALSI